MSKLTFKKDDFVKYIDEKSALIERLLKDGWAVEKKAKPKAEEAPKAKKGE